MLHAVDGEIGRCKDFLFDDTTWIIRYMVADTRKWLPGRKVLVSPSHLRDPNWGTKSVDVHLTREQLKNSPDIDEDAPVSRRQEARWADYFGYRRYWAAPAAWGPIGTAPGPALPVDTSLYRADKAPELEVDESVHVRSCDEMLGYVIRASNGTFGHIADVLIDPDRWVVDSWVLEARELPQDAVKVPIAETRSIDWTARTVEVRLSRESLAGGDAPPLSL